MKRMKRMNRKWSRPHRTDPGFPTPGGRMTVVYTNSLKLIQSTVWLQAKVKPNLFEGPSVFLARGAQGAIPLFPLPLAFFQISPIFQ